MLVFRVVGCSTVPVLGVKYLVVSVVVVTLFGSSELVVVRYKLFPGALEEPIVLFLALIYSL